MQNNSLQRFLDQKPLFYKEIDYERFPRIFSKIKHHFTCKNIIHLVGTNGKGTTGRFLATALYRSGKNVGHYTSPHIVRFNERIWINGNDVTDEVLEDAHKQLLGYLSVEDASSLSYFEYTTLLAMVVFHKCDYIVCEAGLGGEYDATAVFETVLTIATVIDFDHETFLGSDIRSIATTKLNVTKNALLLAKQKHQEVYEVASKIKIQKKIQLYCVEELISQEDKKLSQELSLPSYMQENLLTSIAALNFFNIPYTKESFEKSRLFGRLTPLAKNILLDVGHNPLAATSIKKALGNEKRVLIYNTFADKEYKKILAILKSNILHVEILQIEDQRIEKKEKLQKILKELEIEYKEFKSISKDFEYLVFGSFRVVEEFLKIYE